jgi:serine/threonine protein phosphatase PrpC
MNDYFIYNDQHFKLCALFNGHGEFGHLVSNISRRLLFRRLIRMPIFYTNP